MENTPALVDALIREVVPDGRFTEEDAADVQAIVDATNALTERRRIAKPVARWLPQPDGSLKLDLQGVPTDAERAETARRDLALAEQCRRDFEISQAPRPSITTSDDTTGPRLREIIETRTPPASGAPTHWNPLTCCASTGATPEEARCLWSSKEKWDNWLKARGKHEVSKKDALHDRIAEKRTPIAPPSQDDVERVLAHLRETGQMNPDGDLNPSAKVIPIDQGKKVPPSSMPGRPRIDPDIDMTALEDAPGPGEIAGPDAVIDVPLEERAEASHYGAAGMIGSIASVGAARTPGAFKNLLENGLEPRPVRRAGGA